MFYDKLFCLVFKTSWSIYLSRVNSNALKMHFCHSDTSLLQKWFACSRCSALFTNLGVNVFQALEDILPNFFPSKSHLYFFPTSPVTSVFSIMYIIIEAVFTIAENQRHLFLHILFFQS